MNKSEQKNTSANKLRDILKLWISELDLTVLGWCTKAGIRESTLRNFLNGRNNALGSDTLDALAGAIDKNISELLEGPKSKKGMEHAFIYTIKEILKLLLNKKKPITKELLKKDFIFALNRFSGQGSPGAVLVMENLLEYIEGQTHQQPSQEESKMLQLSPPA